MPRQIAQIVLCLARICSTIIRALTVIAKVLEKLDAQP